LSPGQWHGPVLSGYGVHLIYISSVSEPPAQVLTDVRERVVQDWEMERGEELNDKFYASLRDQYTVVIEDPAEKDKVAVVQETAQ
jgi:peptidyl-prolyl cis-trans isomerase C